MPLLAANLLRCLNCRKIYFKLIICWLIKFFLFLYQSYFYFMFLHLWDQFIVKYAYEEIIVNIFDKKSKGPHILLHFDNIKFWFLQGFFTPPPPLSGPTTKKTVILCVMTLFNALILLVDGHCMTNNA